MSKSPRRVATPTTWSSHWHIGYTLVFCIAGIVAAISFLGTPTAAEYLTIPLAFAFRNAVEYAAHRYPLHRRLTGMGALFDLHMAHHLYFDSDHYEIDRYEDMGMVVFPPIVLNAISVLMGAVAAMLGLAFGSNVALLFFATTLAYYLVMQVTHAMSHVAAGHWAARLPGIRHLWVHHWIHHDTARMSRFNFAFIVTTADRALGTLDMIGAPPRSA